MLVLVSGSRNWADRLSIVCALSRYIGRDDVTIMHGAASRKDPATGEEISADMIADDVARKLGLRVEAYPADWGRHGRGAGIVRNGEMLDRRPDLVMAFQRDGSSGTQDAIDGATARGIRVELHRAGKPVADSPQGRLV